MEELFLDQISCSLTIRTSLTLLKHFTFLLFKPRKWIGNVVPLYTTQYFQQTTAIRKDMQYNIKFIQ